MRRIASVWLPRYPIERLRRARPGVIDDEAPLALVAGGSRGLLVTAVATAAGAEGVRAGQSLADARAILPALLTHPARIADDRRGLLRLAAWAGRYGPSRNVDDGIPHPLAEASGGLIGEHALWIDITGVAHLFGGEAGLAGDLLDRLGAAGLTARIGIADTLGAAVALARHGAGIAIAPAGGTRAVLADLPVGALRLDAETIHLLCRLGLRRVGSLYDLPRQALERRFRSAGPRRAGAAAARAAAGAVLMRLDQALGILAEPRRPLAEPPVHMARLVLSEPLISADGIAAATDRLAAELVQGLASAHRGALEVMLSLYRVDGTLAAVRIATSAPSRDGKHLLRLMGERLDRVDAGFGVDVMTLAAVRTGPLPPGQTAAASLGRSLSEDRLTRLVDSLANRLGADRVLRTGPGASHIPERAAVTVPAMSLRSLSGEETPAVPAGGSGESGPARPPSPLRPPTLLPRPEPIEVLAEVPEGAPQRFTWRRLTRRIMAARGPERIEPEWWRHLAADATASKALRRVRDYWQIEDEGGGRYWVFRDGAWSEGGAERPRWYLHGLYG